MPGTSLSKLSFLERADDNKKHLFDTLKKMLRLFFPPEFAEIKCEKDLVTPHGHDSLLECVLITSNKVTDLEIRSVTWTRFYGRNPEVVLSYDSGETYKGESYSFADPDWKNTNKNVSLFISKTGVEHEGFYECVVETNVGNARLDKPYIVNVTGKMLPNYCFCGQYLACVCACVCGFMFSYCTPFNLSLTFC